ncbi:site-specific integrase [Dyella japonica]|uniref:Tyr recombinase domain-containing protein n=1 Tax=Dyella japonica A8 TaxID=1217721 RepID=A0A075JZH7_9GAMM|nr:site-specific integrase [Dyella japonica]AIF47314.1 hypothetical protein HY57_08530 [Dyella japonica A8]
MPTETHLFLRGRIFYLRLTCPAELLRLRRERGLPLKRTSWLSLATSDPWEARRRASETKGQWLADIEAEWQSLRVGGEALVRRGRVLHRSHLPSVLAAPALQGARPTAVSLEPRGDALVPAGGGAVASSRPARGQRLIDHFDRYLEEQHGAAALRSCSDKRATIRRFVESAGDLSVHAYTAEHVATFKRALRGYPKNAEHVYPGMKFAKVIGQAKVDQAELISPKTINNKLSTLSAFGAWLELNTAGVRAESFRTTPVKDHRSDQRMPPFSDAEVKAILQAPSFTGCESERNQTKLGSYVIRDWRYWIPLICAYSGARLGEVAQLRCADIRQVDGHWIFDITDEGEGQSLKTHTSRRIVPLHAKLQALGLLAYADQARALGHEWLFQSVEPDTDGRRATQVGKWFRKFLARRGISQDVRGAMHRFRHTVVTKLRAAGYPDHEIAPLVGHGLDMARMTAGYGAGQSVSLSRRAAMVAHIEFGLE